MVNLTLLSVAHAQDASTDPFTGTRDGPKLHAASRFVCPVKIGAFYRDAVGPSVGGDLCAYSALNGVYGEVRIVPLEGPYDARSALAPEFIREESLRARRIADGLATLPGRPDAVVIYARTYETARLEGERYRVVFSGAQFRNWAVEVTVEYADPRDTASEDQFLHAVYAAAEQEIAGK